MFFDQIIQAESDNVYGVLTTVSARLYFKFIYSSHIQLNARRLSLTVLALQVGGTKKPMM